MNQLNSESTLKTAFHVDFFNNPILVIVLISTAVFFFSSCNKSPTVFYSDPYFNKLLEDETGSANIQRHLRRLAGKYNMKLDYIQVPVQNTIPDLNSLINEYREAKPLTFCITSPLLAGNLDSASKIHPDITFLTINPYTKETAENIITNRTDWSALLNRATKIITDIQPGTCYVFGTEAFEQLNVKNLLNTIQPETNLVYKSYSDSMPKSEDKELFFFFPSEEVGNTIEKVPDNSFICGFFLNNLSELKKNIIFSIELSYLRQIENIMAQTVDKNSSESEQSFSLIIYR